MPAKYERKSMDVVLSTAESLKKAAEHLTQVALDMKQHKMTDAYFPWTQRQFDCLDLVISLASRCVADLPTQITAKKQNRPSRFEIMAKKSKRDVEARRARNAAADETPPKPRGRTKKSPA